MNKLYWIPALAILGLAAWMASEGEWLVAGLDLTVFAFVLAATVWLARTTRRDNAAKAAEVTALLAITEPFGFEDSDAWKTHLANCAECRDFWKKDGQ